MRNIDDFSPNVYQELSGGLVNTTGVVTTENSERYVHQRSQEIGAGILSAIHQDRDYCAAIGLRQIQVDPAKFVRAKIISEHLTRHDFRHSRILDAQDYHTYGSAMMSFIEGSPGSTILKEDKELVWNRVGHFVANTNQLPHTPIADTLGFDIPKMIHPDWLINRFSALLHRLKANGVDIVDDKAAMDACHKLFSALSEIEQPICLTYDDPKPDSLIFTQNINDDPYVIDLESFTIGHRIIDGIGRALYWGPIREPLKNGRQPDHDAKQQVAQAYNTQVPEDWKILPNTVDLWCVASELFWLPDVVATHAIAPFLPAARLQGTHVKLRRFSALLKALQSHDMEQAKQ
jgi:hypothetical protein